MTFLSVSDSESGFHFGYCDGGSTVCRSETSTPLSSTMSLNEINHNASDANQNLMCAIDPQLIAISSYPDPSIDAPPSAEPQQDYSYDEFTITPSMDSFQAFFCAQSAAWVDGLPMLPLDSQYERYLASHGFNDSTAEQRRPTGEQDPNLSTPPQSTSQSYPQGGSGARQSYHCDKTVTHSEMCPRADRAKVQFCNEPVLPISRLRSLRKYSLASIPPPPLRRSARLKPAVRYNPSSRISRRTSYQTGESLQPPTLQQLPISSKQPPTPRPYPVSRKTSKSKAKRCGTKRGPYVCDQCPDATFTRRADLERHKQSSSVHATEVYGCPGCTRGFTRMDALGRHQRSCKQYQKVFGLEESN